MSHRVFISHAGAQTKAATTLCELLEADAIGCWIAPRDLTAGSDWVDRLPRAVADAELVVVLLSPEALVSDWVDRELNWAISTQRPVLPVVLGDARLSPRVEFLIGTIQHTRLSPSPDHGELKRLVGGIRARLDDDDHVHELISDARPQDAPRPTDPFTHRVTVARPAYFVLLVDHSNSMNRKAPGSDVRVREAVADVVNDLLFRLLQTSRRADGYRHFFDVSIVAYGLGPDRPVMARLPDGARRMAVGDLYGKWTDVRKTPRMQRLPGGGRRKVHVERPVWVEPTPGRGRTLMAAAFREAGELVAEWIAEHPDSVPPVVLNISDGGWTDEPPMAAVRALQEQSTTLGPTMVFNCQLGVRDERDRRAELLFPSEVPERYPARTKELFLLSSVLPESMRLEARARGLDLMPDSRGLVFNAPVSRLVDFLQIGTQTMTM